MRDDDDFDDHVDFTTTTTTTIITVNFDSLFNWTFLQLGPYSLLK